jgi:hypothetical protein
MAKKQKSGALMRYLVRVASDVDALAAFMDAPEKAMAAAGVTQEEQDLIRSGDQNRIYAYLKNLPAPAAAQASPAPQLPTVVASMQLQPSQPAAFPQAQAYPFAGPQPIWLMVSWPQR